MIDIAIKGSESEICRSSKFQLGSSLRIRLPCENNKRTALSYRVGLRDSPDIAYRVALLDDSEVMERYFSRCTHTRLGFTLQLIVNSSLPRHATFFNVYVT